MYHIFFTHSSANGHLGSFHILAIVKSAAVNIGIHLFKLYFSLDMHPGVRLPDYMEKKNLPNLKDASSAAKSLQSYI